MKKLNDLSLLFLSILILFVMVSCNDIIKEDLSTDRINIQTPRDSFTTSYFSIVFIWDALHNAEYYHLQIAQPSFNNMQQLLLDTLLVNTKLSFSLFPGIYQWRIRGENSGSATPYVMRNITVDSNSNLNGQAFFVSTPADNYATNATVVTFSWPAFPYANKYEYVLTDFNNTMIKSKITEELFITDTFLENKYWWKVRALNTLNSTSTQFSSARSLIIDITPPAASTPFKPSNNSLDTNAVTLMWIRPSDVYGDSVIVAKDSLFQNVEINTFKTITPGLLLAPLILYQPYYWRLRSRDLAGNWSPYSATFKFTVIY